MMKSFFTVFLLSLTSSALAAISNPVSVTKQQGQLQTPSNLRGLMRKLEEASPSIFEDTCMSPNLTEEEVSDALQYLVKEYVLPEVGPEDVGNSTYSVSFPQEGDKSNEATDFGVIPPYPISSLEALEDAHCTDRLEIGIGLAAYHPKFCQSGNNYWVDGYFSVFGVELPGTRHHRQFGEHTSFDWIIPVPGGCMPLTTKFVFANGKPSYMEACFKFRPVCNPWGWGEQDFGCPIRVDF